MSNLVWELFLVKASLPLCGEERIYWVLSSHFIFRLVILWIFWNWEVGFWLDLRLLFTSSRINFKVLVMVLELCFRVNQAMNKITKWSNFFLISTAILVSLPVIALAPSVHLNKNLLIYTTVNISQSNIIH